MFGGRPVSDPAVFRKLRTILQEGLTTLRKSD
jgi:hypothetical protein